MAKKKAEPVFNCKDCGAFLGHKKNVSTLYPGHCKSCESKRLTKSKATKKASKAKALGRTLRAVSNRNKVTTRDGYISEEDCAKLVRANKERIRNSFYSQADRIYCQWPGGCEEFEMGHYSPGDKLHMAHVESIKESKECGHAERAYSEDNLVFLCKHHHDLYDTRKSDIHGELESLGLSRTQLREELEKTGAQNAKNVYFTYMKNWKKDSIQPKKTQHHEQNLTLPNVAKDI